MSQLRDFNALLQAGQDMSVETLYGSTLIFTGQGNAGGYAASTGALSEELTADEHGNLLPKYDRAFRIREAMLVADGVVLVEQQTHVTEAGGKTFRVEKVVRRVNDPCLHIACKEV